MLLTGSHIVLEVLAEQKVDTIFGYPGGTILNLYDALYDNKLGIRHFITAHEQGAAHAADGYARATGTTGVCFATSGPGSTNLVTGIATAYMDSIPMVAITANVPSSLIGCDSFQEVYITGITMPITKHNFVVREISQLAETLREAFRIANSGRPGPVLVDIPKDVTAATCEFSRRPAIPTERMSEIDPETIAKIAAEINAAERPVLHFGGGVIGSGASPKVHELTHRASIPACHTIMGTGVLAYNDPLNMGMVGMHGNVSAGLAIDRSDLLIVIGARFSDRVATKPSEFAKRAKIIQIDIDRSEINKNIHIDYSVVGDVGKVLDALLPLIEERSHREWQQQIEDWRKEDVKPIETSQDGALHPYDIIHTIAELAGDDAIIVTDVGQHQMWTAQYCGRTKPRSFLTSGGLGTMGFGYGAAIGAQVAFPHRRVIHITGDGCFHMNLNELCTSVSYELPIVTVVLNNGVLGMVRQWQTLFYDHRYSSTSLYRKTDFAAVADAFGAKGYHADNANTFEAAFADALSQKVACVIECKIDENEMVMPMIPGGSTVNEAYRAAPVVTEL